MTLDPRPLGPALAAAEEAGWTTLRVDLAGVRSKAELMRRWGAALQVPSWFGGNWDALADALIDLSWLPRAPGRLVAVTSWRSYAQVRPGDWETLQEILEQAVDFWREGADGVNDAEGELTVLLAEAPGGSPEGTAHEPPGR
ncbi:barstar family protein [Streptomyces sp. NPDC059761]|uniref:barstar family protein n=1 Tax=Streptomyces sp. NPDC059761 TaxID=3346937 RepID=UPI003667D508